MTDEDFEWCDVCEDCDCYKAIGESKYRCMLEGGRCKGYFAYKKLEAENAAMRERLEKAVELPVKVGDTVWLVGYIHVSADAHLQCVEAKITDLMMMKDLVRYGAQEGDWCHEFTNDAIGEWVFMTREAAEAKIAEQKGEKNE